MTDDKNKRKLYDALSKEYNLGTFEQFSSDVEDEGKRQKLYNAIKDEYDLPDFDGFTNQLIGGSSQASTSTASAAGSTPAAGSRNMFPNGPVPLEQLEGNNGSQMFVDTPVMRQMRENGLGWWGGQQQTAWQGEEGKKSSSTARNTSTQSASASNAASSSGENEKPLGPENFQKYMDMKMRTDKMMSDVTRNMERVRRGNELFSDRKGVEYNPTTGEFEDVYYTTNGEYSTSSVARDMRNKELFYATEEGQKQREKELNYSIDKVYDDYSDYLDNAVNSAWEEADRISSTVPQRKLAQTKNAISFAAGPANPFGMVGHLLTAANSVLKESKAMEAHDLDRMSENAWNGLGSNKKKRMIDEIFQKLSREYLVGVDVNHIAQMANNPSIFQPTEEERAQIEAYEKLRKYAEQLARTEVDRRMYEKAKEMNAPQNWIDYLATRMIEGQMVNMALAMGSRKMAGTTGDWAAKDATMNEYGESHWLLDKAGTVLAFVTDPTTWVSGEFGGAVAKTVVKGALKKATKEAGEAAIREALEATGRKYLQGAVSSGVSLATINSSQELANQAKYGGVLEGFDESGRYIIGDYDLGKVAESGAEGLVLGGLTGVTGRFYRNVGTKLAKGTESTVGKGLVRGGEDVLSVLTSGTIFEAPQAIRRWKEYDQKIASLSDPKSANYIADDAEREKKIAELKEERGDVILDEWGDNIATMAAFHIEGKVKSAPQVLRALSKGKGDRAGFETRLRRVLDGVEPELALTKEERAELERGGYTDLKELVEDYGRYEEERKRSGKAKEENAGKKANWTNAQLEAGEGDGLPYNRFVELIKDQNISEAARAKMYYYVTGRTLPMSTIMGSSPIEEVKDASGKVTGYRVKSFGANGVITSRTFGSEREARMEQQRIDRQVELNSAYIGEQFFDKNESERMAKDACDVVGKRIGVTGEELYKMLQRDPSQRSAVEKEWVKEIENEIVLLDKDNYGSESLRKYLNEKYDVDIDKVIGKEPKRRSEKEKEALHEYYERLYADPKKEDNTPRGIGYEASETERKDIAIALAEAPEKQENREAWEGVMQRIEDDADYKTAEYRGTYDRISRKDGSVVGVKLNEKYQSGDFKGLEKDGWVVDGDVVLREDGSVDEAKSTETLIVVDGETGERRVMSPKDILGVDQMTSKEEVDADVARYRKELVDAALRDAEGIVDVQPGYRFKTPEGEDAEVIAVDGDEAVYKVDGKDYQMGIKTKALQEMADRQAYEAYVERKRRRGEEAVDESAVRDENSVEVAEERKGKPEVFEPDMEVTIKDEDGKEKTVVVTGVRGRFENGRVVEDPNGRYVEMYDPETQSMLYIHETDPKKQIVGWKEAPKEEQSREVIESRGDQEPPDDGGTPPPPPAGVGVLKDAKTFEEQEKEQKGPKVKTPETFTPDTYLPENKVTMPAAPVSDNAVAMPMVETTKGRGKTKRTETSPDWYAATPSRTQHYIYNELGFTPDVASEVVKANMTEIDKAIDSLKKKEPKPTANPVAYKEAHDTWESELQTLKEHRRYWDEVREIRQGELTEELKKKEAERLANETAEQKAKREVFEAEQARRQAEAEEAERRRKEEDEQKASGTYTAPVQMTESTEPIEGTKTSASQLEIAKRELADDAEAMEMLNDKDPQTLEEIASTFMRSGKNQLGIIPEDFYNHTGYGPSDAEAFKFILSNNGVTISHLGELVEGEARSEHIPFDENDPMVGFNAVLNVIGEVRTPGDINNYITNRRIRQAYEHYEKMMEREDAYMSEQLGVTRAEYEVWLQSLEEKAEAVKNMSDEEFYNTIFGDDITLLGNEKTQDNDRRTETDNGSAGEEGADALQGEQQEGEPAGAEKDDTRGVGEDAGGEREAEPAEPAEQPASPVAEAIASQEVEENPTEGQKEAGNLPEDERTRLQAQYDAANKWMEENVRSQKAGRNLQTPTKEQKTFVKKLADWLNKIGIKTHLNVRDSQKVLDKYRELVRALRAYHGSGADFDAFDHSHMGEGEGAQAYGYGSYVTDVEGIGRTYAKASGDRNLGNRPTYIASRYDYFYKGQPIDQTNVNPLQMACGTAMNTKNIAEARRKADYFASIAEVDGNTEMAEKWKEAHRILLESKKTDFVEKPHKPDYYLYTVEIPDDNGSNYLEWDKPIREDQLTDIDNNLALQGIRRQEVSSTLNGEQKTFIRFTNDNAIVELYDGMTGEELYRVISRLFAGNDKSASEFLHNAGFTGIKYPAQFMTGGRSDNAKNYVIFDEGDLKIVDKIRFHKAEDGEYEPEMEGDYKFFKTPEGEVYGFTVGGEIYIDPRYARPDTPIHEYTHLWAQGLRNRNAAAWKQLTNEMKTVEDGRLWDYVKGRYPELKSEDEFVEEVFAHYSGKRGAERLENEMREEMKKADGIFEKAQVANIFHKLRDLLQKFWSMARDLFAGKVKGVENLSAEDFADMALGDLLGGFDPRVENKERVKERDKAYMEAVERGDMETAQRMVDAEARRKGYISGADYRMTHRAPNRKDDVSLADLSGNSIVPDDYWTHPQYYQYEPYDYQSFYQIRNAMNNAAEKKAAGKKAVGSIIMYRAVPKSVKEDTFRNGDWISPSLTYAKQEGESIPGGYRIISMKCKSSNVWWDANDINEWGYDDGKDYAYKNTKNNRKLLDAVTYDDDGNVIPLSKRFNSRNSDIRFQKSGTYTTKDGVQLSMMSLFEGTENLNDNANLNDKGDLTALRLRKLEPGETCHVERRYEENKQFSFMGKERIESMDDVAYIFKQLENAAVENSFIALVKDGKPTIIHTGMGSYAATSVDVRQAMVAYEAIKPEKVYFIHNHPSGTLKASTDDRNTLQAMRAIFGNDVVQDGIIIDTTSGKYGVFGWDVSERDMQEGGDEVPLKVYEFSKQVFSEDWKPQTAYKITDSKDIAKFISSQKYGKHPKMNFIVVNNQLQVVSNLFLPWTKLSDIKDMDAACRKLSGDINQAGGVKGIIYGNYQYDKKDKRLLQTLTAGMQTMKTPLMDVVHVDVNDELGYHSAHDEGVMEPEEVYVTPRREAGEDIFAYARRIADDYSAYEAIMKAYEDAHGGVMEAHDDSGRLDSKERITDYVLGLAERNKGVAKFRDMAMQAITSNLVDIQKELFRKRKLTGQAVRDVRELAEKYEGNLEKAKDLQKEFDKQTVQRVTDLATSLISYGYIDNMRASHVKKLLSDVYKSTGKENIKEYLDDVVDIIVDSQLKRAEEALDKLNEVREVKIDAKGVKVQGRLDIAGQQTLETFRKARGMQIEGENGIDAQINEAKNKMGSDNKEEAEEATNRYAGLMLAKDYIEKIKGSEVSGELLYSQIREEERKIYDFTEEVKKDADGNVMTKADGTPMTERVRRLKPEFKPKMEEVKDADGKPVLTEKGNVKMRMVEPVSEKNQLIRKQVEQSIASMKDSVRDSKMKRLNDYNDLMGRLGGRLQQSIEGAKAWKEAQKERMQKIQHYANSDMEGREMKGHQKDNTMDKLSNNVVTRTVLMPLMNYDQMLRLFGRKNPDGKGYLWEFGMYGWQEAVDGEQLWLENYMDKMNEGAERIVGTKYRKLEDYANSKKGMTFTYWDGAAQREYDLPQSRMMYLYAVDKMPLGRATNRRMGFTDEDMAAIEKNLDPKLKEFVDWVQGDLLPEMGKEVGKVYERMFGTKMTDIENYFPFVRDKEAIKKERNIEDQPQQDRITTVTKAVKERTMSTAIWDMKAINFFDVLTSHVTEMSHWANFAELNRDLNTLVNYKNFRQKVMGMHTIYGAGENLLNNFAKTCAIATDCYMPKTSDYDKQIAQVTKGVTMGKVAARPFTAAKQVLSEPAFWGNANPVYILEDLAMLGLVPAYKSHTNFKENGDAKMENCLQWAWRNLPNFRKRVKSRTMGDYYLRDAEYNDRNWIDNVQEKTKWGMIANISVDAWTIALGAHAVYRTQKDKYLRWGMSEEKAEKRAIKDAEITPNQSQQSSEGAFVAPLQVDHTVAGSAAMVFRNSSTSYTREWAASNRNLKRLTGGEIKVDNVAKQILRATGKEEWTDEEWQSAKRMARREIRGSIKRNVVNNIIFGWVLPWTWRLGGLAPLFLLSGDDDEKKKRFLEETKKSVFGPLEGLLYGDVLSDVANKAVGFGDRNWKYVGRLAPVLEDASRIKEKIGYDPTGATTDCAGILLGMVTGINPQTVVDWTSAIVDKCSGDRALSREGALLAARLLNCPPSQLKQLYFEELDMNGEEASKYTPEQLVERWAIYKVKNGHMMMLDDELVEKEKEHAMKYLKERVNNNGGKELNDAYAKYADIRKSYAEQLEEFKASHGYKDAALMEKAELIDEYNREHAADYAVYATFDSMDKVLDKIVKYYLGAKRTKEAQLCQQAIVDYKRQMVAVMNAQDDASRKEERQKLAKIIADFYKEYGNMQSTQWQEDRLLDEAHKLLDEIEDKAYESEWILKENKN